MGTAFDLWSAFLALKPGRDDDASSAVRCGDRTPHLLVKGVAEEPVFLLRTTTRRTPRAPVRLKHIRVVFETAFELTDEGAQGVTEGTFCKVSCNPLSRTLHRYFVETIAAGIRQSREPLTSDEIDSFLDRHLELFKRASEPARNTVMGLWGELLLIWSAESRDQFVAAWHASPSETFDFAFARNRVDVKTTGRALREHDFSLSQVRAGNTNDLVASLVVVQSGAGKGILQLAREIAVSLSPQFEEKLWCVVVDTLGSDVEDADDVRYDVDAAIKSLRLFPAHRVPAPIVMADDSPFVSDVRFRANITGLADEFSLPLTSLVARPSD